MKKLVLFFATVLLTAISANVFAQNTGTSPSVGSTHDYWVNATDESNQTSGVGNTYVWWISKAADLVAVETPGTDFTVGSSSIYGTPGDINNFTIELKWLHPSAGGTYYLVVEEIDGDGCSNKKAVAIQPHALFDVQFVALESNGTTIGDNLSRCAPDVALSAVGTTITYEYGSDEYLFKLVATDIHTGWEFANSFSNTVGSATATIHYKIGAAGTWTTPLVTPILVPVNAAGTEEVYIRVTLDNTSAEEGTSAQTMQLTLSDVKNEHGTAVNEITDSTGADITGSPIQTQGVNARPATSTIGSN